MEKKRKIKVILESEIKCAFCGKANVIKVEKETIEPAVPAEFEIRVSTSKSDQSKLVE